MEIRTFVDIAAPPARVWSVLADFAGYDRWNPMLRHMRGKLEIGSKLRFAVPFSGLPVPLTAEVITVEPGHELAWLGPAGPRWMRRVISGEHYFRLTAIAKGTRFEHGELFRGAAVPARWDRLEKVLAPAYANMNESLRHEVEAS